MIAFNDATATHETQGAKANLPTPRNCTAPDYQAKLDAVKGDSIRMAHLTIALLEHMALDPCQGTTVAEHTPFRGALVRGGPGEAYIALEFHRVSNFIGGFFLSEASPVMQELLSAIARNLSSKMFKAAQMDRRLEQSVPSHYARFREKAEAAYSAAYVAAEQGAPAWKAYDNVERCQYFEEKVYPVARAASTAVLAPLQDRLLSRLIRVRNLAYDEDFRGSYWEIQSAFARRYLGQNGIALN